MNEPGTPLSDLITEHAKNPTKKSLARFIEEFRRSELGVHAVGIPARVPGFTSTSDHPISVGMTKHAKGRKMVLAFADPQAFAKKFGQKFNAGISGEAIFGTVALNPACDGILVNSAKDVVSIVINRKTALSAHRRASICTKPWWKFW